MSNLKQRLASHAVGVTLVCLLLFGLLLRVWGVEHGLPYVYNIDERSNFVSHAIGMFGHSFNPGYFVNPPAFTYLLFGLFGVGFGGKTGVGHAFATDPTAVFVLARLASAVLGVIAVWLLFLVGKRFFNDARKGLVAAALLTVGFLPVFYSHLALNDVPTLAPITACLLGVAGILKTGRRRDYLLAGGALGVACATKYTAGILLLPLITAVYLRWQESAHLKRRAVWDGIVWSAVLFVIGFVVLNPYAVLDRSAFIDGITHQSSAAGDGAGKLGITQRNGIVYYLWSLTWGLGWIPAFCALGGVIVTFFRERKLALLLAPAPILFIIFMGLQDRYFGRWLLPIFPIVCLLAAYFLVVSGDWISARTRVTSQFAVTALVLLALAQGTVFSVHNDLVLSRTDTRQLTRTWLMENVPPGSKIVVEPVVPDQWIENDHADSHGRLNRWTKLRTSRSTVNNDGTQRPGGAGRSVTIEDYEFTTRPQLIDSYIKGGFCWVITGSTQADRATVNPKLVPRAIAYYRDLARRAEVLYRVSPYNEGKGPVPFNFDWSFDYYPLAYYSPGPVMTVYRLRNCT